MAELGPAASQRDEDRGQLRQPVEPLRRLVSGVGETFAPRFAFDVAAYLEDRSETGARPSTLRVVAAAIARNHKDAGVDVPVQHDIARSVLDELTRDDAPGPSRALPLDLDCYLAIRKTAHKPRWGRGGRMERAASACVTTRGTRRRSWWCRRPCPHVAWAGCEGWNKPPWPGPHQARARRIGDVCREQKHRDII